MKRILTIFIVVLMMFSLVGCGSKVKLEEDQMYVTITKDEEAVVEIYMSQDTAEDSDIDLGDKKKDIQDDFTDSFDEMDIDVKVKDFDVKKDKYLKATFVVEDVEDFGLQADYTVGDYVDDNEWMYEDAEAFADEYEFQTFDKGKDIDSDTLEDYEDNQILTISGGEEGAYYTVPGKILLVSDIKFEKVSKDTIFIEDGEYGFIVYK